jgi:hypothetical protein
MIGTAGTVPRIKSGDGTMTGGVPAFSSDDPGFRCAGHE